MLTEKKLDEMNKIEHAEKIVANRCRNNDGLYIPRAISAFFKTEVRYISEKGYYGAFAGENIPAGAIIGINGGRIIDNVAGIPEEMKYGVAIDAGKYLMPSDYNSIEDLLFMNHCCEPNVEGIGVRLSIAKRGIKSGEELTTDYAALVADEENWSMVCSCGVPTCRNVIRGDDWKNPVIAKRLWKSFSPHIQRKIINASIINFS